MSQSLAAIYVHLVFSTKARHPFLTDSQLREEMANVLASECLRAECQAVEIGGTEDHVHILARMAKKVAVSDLVRSVKTNSSGWAKQRHASFSRFAWQSGYGAFSVDSSRIPIVRQYIQNQEEHHKVVSFKDEFLQLMAEHDLSGEVDERYVWD